MPRAPKRRGAEREDSSHGKGKELTLLEASCTDDPHVTSRRCLESWETSRTCKKVEESHLRINEGVFT